MLKNTNSELYPKTQNESNFLLLAKAWINLLTFASDREEFGDPSSSFHCSNSSWSESPWGTTKSVSLLGDDCFAILSFSRSNLRRSISFFLSSFLFSISCLRFSLSCFRILSLVLRVNVCTVPSDSGLNLFSKSMTPLTFVGPMFLIFFSLMTLFVDTEKQVGG